MKKINAYTLVELTISITILGTIIVSAMTIFSNVLKSRERLSKENLLYNETRLAMEYLVKEVRNNVIDYSEYYNRQVLDGDFGQNYSMYAKRFIDPGENCENLDDGDNNLDANFTNTSDLGGCCYNPNTLTYEIMDPDVGSCTADLEPTNVGQDLWSGSNPYSAENRYDVAPDDANAFCDDETSDYNNNKCIDIDSSESVYKNTELYLISEDGETKEVIGREIMFQSDGTSTINALAYAKLKGKDTDSDGVFETWECDSSLCSTSPDVNFGDLIRTAAETNISEYFKDFIPFSSSSINITDLKFYISPLEDPSLAYLEDDAKDEMPAVTIIMTAKLSDTKGLVNPDAVSITLQTTLTPKYEEVKSYRID